MGKTSSVVITLDLKSAEMTATVSGHVVEKYARAMLQKKLVEETGYERWMCWARDHNKSGDYVFEVTNPLYEMRRVLDAVGRA